MGSNVSPETEQLRLAMDTPNWRIGRALVYLLHGLFTRESHSLSPKRNAANHDLTVKQSPINTTHRFGRDVYGECERCENVLCVQHQRGRRKNRRGTRWIPLGEFRGF